MASSSSPSLSLLSGSLSQLGAEVRRDRVQLLGDLVRQLTGFSDGEENFDIALEFSLYNVDHHSFLDVDPAQVDELYQTLERRLEVHACLDRQKQLRETKRKLIETHRTRSGRERTGGAAREEETTLGVRDGSHRILSLLYWLAGNPVHAAPVQTQDWQSTGTSEKQQREDNSLEGRDGQPLPLPSSSEDKWSIQQEIDLCDSSSSLSDWDVDGEEDNLTSDDEDTSLAVDVLGGPERTRDASGVNASSSSSSRSVDLVARDASSSQMLLQAQRKSNKGSVEAWKHVLPRADKSEKYLIRKLLLVLRGGNDGTSIHSSSVMTRHRRGDEDSAFDHDHDAPLRQSILEMVEDLVVTTGALRTKVKEAVHGDEGEVELPTFLAFNASVSRELDSFLSHYLDLERTILAGKLVTLLEFGHELEAHMHKIKYLDFIATEVYSSLDLTASAHVVASKLLSKLQQLWFNSDLDVDFEEFNPTSLVLSIFQRSLQPYLRYLSMYLSEGRVVDSHGEFFVRVAPHIDVKMNANAAAFWSEGHKLRRSVESDCIAAPDFLLPEVHTILLSGKALNILHQPLPFNSGSGSDSTTQGGLGEKIKPLVIPWMEDKQVLECVREREANFVSFAHKEKQENSSLSFSLPSSRTMLEEFRTSYREPVSASSVTESPNSILGGYPEDVSWLEPKSTDEFAQIHNALFGKGSDLKVRQVNRAERVAADDDEEKDSHKETTTSFLCPPQEFLHSTLTVPIQRYCQEVEERLLDRLRKNYALLEELDVLKQVFFLGSADIMGTFMCTLFDRMATSSFWDDETELNASFQDSCTHNYSLSERSQCIVERTRFHVKAPVGYADDKKAGKGIFHEIQRLSLSYKLPWPLDMFVNETHFSKYNDLFVFLSQLSATKHALNRLFLESKTSRNAERYEMSVFVERVFTYVREEVEAFSKATTAHFQSSKTVTVALAFQDYTQSLHQLLGDDQTRTEIRRVLEAALQQRVQDFRKEREKLQLVLKYKNPPLHKLLAH